MERLRCQQRLSCANDVPRKSDKIVVYRNGSVPRGARPAAPSVSEITSNARLWYLTLVYFSARARAKCRCWELMLAPCYFLLHFRPTYLALKGTRRCDQAHRNFFQPCSRAGNPGRGELSLGEGSEADSENFRIAQRAACARVAGIR